MQVIWHSDRGTRGTVFYNSVSFPCIFSWAAQEEDFLDLDFSDLNITEEPDLFLDEAVGHIQANLEDELVQEALRKASLHPRRAMCMCVCVTWYAICFCSTMFKCVCVVYVSMFRHCITT